MVASTENPAGSPTADPEVVAYWKYRRRTARSLIGVGIGVLVAIVFNQPVAWAVPSLAYAALYASWLCIALCAIAAFTWNGEMSERKGFWRGKHGVLPPDLAKPKGENLK